VLKILLGGQNVHLKVLCGLQPPKRAHAKIRRKSQVDYHQNLRITCKIHIVVYVSWGPKLPFKKVLWPLATKKGSLQKLNKSKVAHHHHSKIP